LLFYTILGLFIVQNEQPFLVKITSLKF